MTNIDDAEIGAALRQVHEQMPLLHEDVASARLLCQGAESQVKGSRRGRARLTIPLVIIGGSLGLGASVAVALGVANDGSHAAFTQLHPDKTNVMSSTEEPHALIGNLSLTKGELLRVYATTQSGLGACVLVEHVTSTGGQIDSVSYCGDEPAATADVRLVNGAEVGWVPDSSVGSVTVASSGYSTTAPVVAHHFVVIPATGIATGSVLTVTGRRADGSVAGIWQLAVN